MWALVLLGEAVGIEPVQLGEEVDSPCLWEGYREDGVGLFAVTKLKQE